MIFRLLNGYDKLTEVLYPRKLFEGILEGLTKKSNILESFGNLDSDHQFTMIQSIMYENKNNYTFEQRNSTIFNMDRYNIPKDEIDMLIDILKENPELKLFTAK